MSKIGIDLRMVTEGQSGISRYSLELSRHLVGLDSGHQYTLFFNQAGEKIVTKCFSGQPNVILVMANVRHYSFAEQAGFVRMLNKHNLDLMHFTNFNVPIMYKKPYVVTIHDVVHHKISGQKKVRFFKFLAYKKIISTAVKNSRAIITVSQFSKSDIIKTFKIPARKVEVIHEGASLNTDFTEEDVNKIKNKYLLNKPYFLFVGVLERKKNIINLTRGFDKFLENFNLDMDLVIAGPADKHYPEIRHKAQDISNKNRLVFTDFVEDRDLGALYKGAFAFVSASLHEGFGLPGVEAMRFGLPLIVSNLDVFNEVYDNAAVYFDPQNPEDIAEKLFLLANDHKYYEELSKKSLIRAKFFNWPECAQKTLNLYNQITVIE